MEIGFNILYGNHTPQKELGESLIEHCIEVGIPEQKKNKKIIFYG